MDQVKIGKFIAECRKNKKITQVQLAEKLNITDRAISKWETGKGMPDTSIMLDLCKELGISVNELLSGEVMKMENYNKKAEENLMELNKLIEDANRRLLIAEVFIIIISITAFLLSILGANIINDILYRNILIGGGIFILAISIIISFKIEMKAGFYECKHCHHRYVPTFKQTMFAPHMGWTKYLKCPKCGGKSWNKKVLSK